MSTFEHQNGNSAEQGPVRYLNGDSIKALCAGPTDNTSVSLLQRVRANDSQAWSHLVDLYGPLVYGWCSRSGLGASDISDVMQEIFASVARGLDGFRRNNPGDTFRGWLRVIARNHIRGHYRQAVKRPAPAGGTEALKRIQAIPDELEAPTENQLERENSELVRRALEIIHTNFEPLTFQAFWSVVVDGRQAVDVAAELNLSPGAVRQAKYKVLRRLRAELGDLVELPV